MATTAKGLALVAKINALTGPTAGQKTQLVKVADVIDARIVNGVVLDDTTTKIYDALNALT